jgi:L-2-hydroxyglutarate oxidase LhgO
MNQVKEAQFLICGCGIIGLTIAKRLIETGHEGVVIIEKEKELGCHASGRNSGVLHAGIYYTADSLKARFSVRGNQLMKEYCRKNGLALLESGKVVVARDQSEIEVLNELYKRGERNGAKVELVDEKSLKEIEPYAKTHKQALYSYNTAVVDPKEILDCLYEELISSGKISILTNTRMIGIKEKNTVITNSGSIKYRNFINAAGAYSDKVAHLFGVGFNYKLIPFKGTYRKLTHEKSFVVKGNIYPVPNIKNPFLGVHLTKCTDGDVYIGPTAIPAFGRENYGMLDGVDSEAFDIFYREAILFIKNPKFRLVALEESRKYWFRYFFKDIQCLVNGLTPDDIEGTSKVGIRPQLVDWKSGELIMDFVVIEEGNSIHVLNAISPAFTCAMAFAEFVVDEYLS